MIDYSPASPWAAHVRALAIIESGEDPTAIGDGGLASGLLQMHPGRFLEEAKTSGTYAIHTGDSWAVAQIKAGGGYFESLSPSPLTLVVMAWNLGRAGVFLRGERNDRYWERWKEAYAKVCMEEIRNRAAP